MDSERSSGLDPVVLPGWRWQRFLDHAVTRLEPLGLQAYPIEAQFLERRGSTGSRAQPTAVATCTWAACTQRLRQIRAACVEAERAASVLNLVINPSAGFDLPFFGADLVTLPSGHLLALDLQPVDRQDAEHTGAVWARLLPLFERWRPLLPDGGPIPAEAEPFFSPGFLWTRLPHGEDSDALIETVVFEAFSAYLDLYLTLERQAEPVTAERARLLLEGQRRYTRYRSEKDPARGMLTRFYGADWTEQYIHEVLFDLERAGAVGAKADTP